MNWRQIVSATLAACGAAALTVAAGAVQGPVTIRAVTYNIKHGRGNDDVVDLKRTADVLRAANVMPEDSPGRHDRAQRVLPER